MPGTAPQTFLSLCLALCLCSACDDPVARRLSSRVLAVEGQAQRLTADGATPLNPESWIVPEEKILIAPGGRVDLMILPGIWAELDGGSELELVALLLERNGDDWIHPMRKRQATVRLVQGSIYIALQQSQTRSRLIIHTPVGTVFAGAGRAGKVEARSNQVSILSARDEFVFEPNGQTQRLHIPAAHLTQWPGLAKEPVPSALAGATAQAEVREVIEVRKRLFTLAEKAVARFPSAATESISRSRLPLQK